MIEEDNIQEYKLCRVPFWMISSTFFQRASTERHLDKYNSETADQLKENIYMYNLIIGNYSPEDEIKL